jgi:Xaa-Pro aminopeptidase
MTFNAARADQVRTRFDGIDALLVSDLTNIRWLTGFTGSNGWVFLGARRITLVTDGRYGAQARRQLDASGVDAEILVGTSGAEINDHLTCAARAVARLGFEADHVTVSEHRKWLALLPSTLLPTTGLVEACRRSKDNGEIEAIARACAIADKALADVAPLLGNGLTEADVRNRLETRMRELGASGPSYETIVATGPINSALPHHRPTNTPIEPGHTVIIDVGALVDGYHSDMTRSYVIGAPTDEQHALYELVLTAQRAGVAAVRPGITTAELDATCRSVVTDAGYGDWFSHGTGHGVGLLIHEDPFVNASGGWTLQSGDVVTVEPGLYREGFGGFRVEDLVAVTDDGHRVLTASPKDAPCLPSPPTI